MATISRGFPQPLNTKTTVVRSRGAPVSATLPMTYIQHSDDQRIMRAVEKNLSSIVSESWKEWSLNISASE